MSGIMAAVAGGTQNVIYAAGLYNTTLGVDTTPITASGSSFTGAVSYNYTWIGYYRPATTGSVTLGLQCPYTEYRSPGGQTSWGGGGNSIGYMWIGNTARSGFNSGNAIITANDSTATSVQSLTAGLYYPVRINWTTSLPYFFDDNFFQDYTYYAESSLTFTVNGSSSVSGLVWYNRLTNGF
jgi:hypothetical protein